MRGAVRQPDPAAATVHGRAADARQERGEQHAQHGARGAALRVPAHQVSNQAGRNVSWKAGQESFLDNANLAALKGVGEQSCGTCWCYVVVPYRERGDGSSNSGIG